MKLARGQARSVIPPTVPMCRKGPVAWGGKNKRGVSQHQSMSPKYTRSNARDLPLQPVLLEDPQCQGGRDRLLGDRTDSLLWSSHLSSIWWQMLQAGLQEQKEHLAWPGSRSQGQGINPNAHSHSGGFSQHPAAQPHRPSIGRSGGVPGIEVTHLQGDTSAFPLLRPLYSQPCEGCSHHQGS